MESNYTKPEYSVASHFHIEKWLDKALALDCHAFLGPWYARKYYFVKTIRMVNDCDGKCNGKWLYTL